MAGGNVNESLSPQSVRDGPGKRTGYLNLPRKIDEFGVGKRYSCLGP